eukprot:EG_transcript_18677
MESCMGQMVPTQEPRRTTRAQQRRCLLCFVVALRHSLNSRIRDPEGDSQTCRGCKSAPFAIAGWPKGSPTPAFPAPDRAGLWPPLFETKEKVLFLHVRQGVA